MRILIAEDDQVLADGLLRTLRASGAAADHVGSGTEADAALMTNTEFDLLILDLGLPRMHGLEVLKRLRARGSALPVLILTAADSVEERVKGLDYGADDYDLRYTWLLLHLCDSDADPAGWGLSSVGHRQHPDQRIAVRFYGHRRRRLLRRRYRRSGGPE